MLNNDGLKVIYWDACVPLSYINGHVDRLPHIEAMMKQARNKEFHLITSTLSIVEIAWAKIEQDNKALDADSEAAISNLWVAGSPIELVEFYEEIGRKAQLLMRAGIPNGWNLKPADAIHLASADKLKVAAFHTYDPALSKYSELTETKFPIHEPLSDAPYLALGAAVQGASE
ncbi:MAG: hypothetical protein JWO13_3133 [Acidobacteriales bacterium]|nr:hypothetical protein [Terriglobales bacterium]